jgi:acetylxylan esterase
VYLYAPDKVAAKPAVIVAVSYCVFIVLLGVTILIILQLHPCGGTASQWYSGTKLPSYADRLGFVLIYAGTPNMNNCWDVQSAGSLTHNQGGDALGIVSMVNYTLNKYSGDASRVYVMGGSSGAMVCQATLIKKSTSLLTESTDDASDGRIISRCL